MRAAPRGRLAIAAALIGWAGALAAACPPQGETRDGLLALKASGFVVEEDARRQSLALALLDCLGDADPLLRDGVAFEGLSSWMRADALDATTRLRMLDALEPVLTADDAEGFRPPFAALVLSEVARTDRLAPWMEGSRRAALAAAAAAYLRGVRDRRGFIDGQGWRHGVAHGADLVLQLAANPNVDAASLTPLRAALAAQIAPIDTPPYVHGEPMRLAQAMFQLARRDAFDADDWTRWFSALSNPAPWPDWSVAFSSEAALARRHNLTSFLSAAYLLAREGGDAAAAERLLPGLRAALRAVP